MTRVHTPPLFGTYIFRILGYEYGGYMFSPIRYDQRLRLAGLSAQHRGNISVFLAPFETIQKQFYMNQIESHLLHQLKFRTFKVFFNNVSRFLVHT